MTRTALGVHTDRASILFPAIFASLFGVFMLYGVALANAQAAHDAAHDTRHAFAFPCH
ncbi:MAG: CbtB-domain containing protein [Rhodospirillaceae bacterium]|nr:CbtB-domain containing protein [Rhodospirillaceae bacterium]MBT5373038.1 CbtB-domain containing protein [Rhodospirillaceae bacterium]MBT5659938.1 CbtB-domain containing protein [Rhodospirillaceae bacterium]MBT5751830.1 CbtB-domain containing protein [Rhodospirillaceae bacterium]